MGSEAPADELMNEENPTKNPSSISKVADEICGDIVEAKNITLLSQSSELKDDQVSSIGPVTPDSNRENGEQNQDFLSPLTVVLPSSPHTNSSDGNTLETPQEALFDSFAPGPDKFMLAPKQRKYGEESRKHVVKRLNFSCATNLVKDFDHEASIETMSDEDRLYEIVHNTILNAIFSEQAKSRDSDDSDFERPRTPKSARILSWVAETCPGAPMKSTRKVIKIDQEMCRKLEF